MLGAIGLSFHPHCRGSNISLNSCLHQATRIHSFHNGLAFSNRPLLPKEKVRLKVLEIEQRWFGALRLGFTSVNPSNIDRNALPPFACPNLVNTSGFWAMGIPEEQCQEGAELCFWVDRKGQVFYQVKGHLRPKLLFSGLPRKAQIWAMMDVYGKTKAVQLLDDSTECLDTPYSCPQNKVDHKMGTRNNFMPVALDTLSQSPQSKYHSMQEPTKLDLYSQAMKFRLFREDEPICVICQDRLVDTLLLPCRHCSFCKPCVLKIRRQNNICPLCRQDIFSMQDVGEMPLLPSQGS
ncbi:E3 ubiquitin-protein ligase NEURL3 isoform X2 [Pseudophryne corroboree]|uniref:E3 ubiquitin-protein ligase NEURL3 isoform X2 n=1 Tax=Pseudophryne corroboree TaxID=495146 RepID=UPI003081D8F1